MKGQYFTATTYKTKHIPLSTNCSQFGISRMLAEWSGSFGGGGRLSNRFVLSLGFALRVIKDGVSNICEPTRPTIYLIWT